MNVAAIWALLAGDELDHAANRPNDWGNLADALAESKRRLDAAAKQLETVWPAARNASAQAFQGRISLLSSSMQETLTKAETTKASLNGVVTALIAAKDTVEKLKQQRESKANDIVPRWIDHAEDHLDTQAQDAMRRAEAAVADHSANLQPPALYQLTVASQTGDDHKIGDPAGSRKDRPTLRAEPTAVTTPSGSSFDYPVVGDGSSGHPGAATHGGGSGGSEIGPGTSGSTGPVLSGVLPTGVSPSAFPTPVSPIGGPLTGASAGPGGLPSGLGVLPLGAGALIPGAGGFGGPPTGTGATDNRTRVRVREALPFGAVIGGDSEHGGVRTGGTRTGETPALMGSAGRGGRGKRDGNEVLQGKADQLWHTREGVAAVIEPDRTAARHDPGPGVIGPSR